MDADQQKHLPQVEEWYLFSRETALLEEVPHLDLFILAQGKCFIVLLLSRR